MRSVHTTFRLKGRLPPTTAMRLLLALLLVLLLAPLSSSLQLGRTTMSAPKKLQPLHLLPQALASAAGQLNLNAIITNEWYVMSMLSMSGCLGLVLEKTRIGATLSSPLTTMATTLIMCNCGILPHKHFLYSAVCKYLVALAVPMLLFDADMNRVMKETGSLLKAFLVGTVGTIVGTTIAYALIPMKNIMGSEKIISALCSRHIGGAVNFIAVCDLLKGKKSPSTILGIHLTYYRFSSS